MAVRIRLKKMGRRHRPFFRICAIDARCPRDGKVIEELGYYDPMVRETDARAVLHAERIDYWLGVGAQPTEKVKVLIKKYGSKGTHLEQQNAARERLKIRPQAPPPVPIPRRTKQSAAEREGAEGAAPQQAPQETTTEPPTESSGADGSAQ